MNSPCDDGNGVGAVLAEALAGLAYRKAAGADEMEHDEQVARSGALLAGALFAGFYLLATQNIDYDTFSSQLLFGSPFHQGSLHLVVPRLLADQPGDDALAIWAAMSSTLAIALALLWAMQASASATAART